MGRFLAWLIERKRRKEEREAFERKVLASLEELKCGIAERDKSINAEFNDIKLLLNNIQPAILHTPTARELLNEYLYGEHGDE